MEYLQPKLEVDLWVDRMSEWRDLILVGKENALSFDDEEIVVIANYLVRQLDEAIIACEDKNLDKIIEVLELIRSDLVSLNFIPPKSYKGYLDEIDIQLGELDELKAVYWL